MKQKTKNAFTLIELMISITIIAILTLMSIAPYNYYQNKASLKIASRELSQVLYESRNMAVNWAIWTEWNVSIWVYLEVLPDKNTYLKVFSYPHDIWEVNITNIEWWDVKLIKTVRLQKWVIIDNLEGRDNLLFFFNSITWNLTYYTWLWNEKAKIDDNMISINISFKWSDLPMLNKTINYYTETNIIDY